MIFKIDDRVQLIDNIFLDVGTIPRGATGTIVGFVCGDALKILFDEELYQDIMVAFCENRGDEIRRYTQVSDHRISLLKDNNLDLLTVAEKARLRENDF